jgi:transcriptional regulator with PAS, ATPase and Fis domain
MPQDQDDKPRLNSISFSPNAMPAFNSLPLESAEEFLQARDATAPIVHVISIEQANALIEKFSAIIHNCGDQPRRGKHRQTIELSRCMLKKHPKIPLITAVYGKQGRTQQGIFRLLSRAGNDRNLYLVAVDNEILRDLNRSVGEQKAIPPSQTYFLQNIKDDLNLANIYMGSEAAFVKVRKQILVAATNDLNVLILGESGTGKELVAREIHNRNERSQQKGLFMAVNCAAISPYLLEAEMFGVEAGALGKNPLKIGLWEQADKGTLFLDEIGNMSLDHQARILRAVQTKQIMRVGGIKYINVDVRLIAATNKDLLGMIARNEFMADLYSRLSCIVIYTPALRESQTVIASLAQKEWEKITGQNDNKLPREIIELLPKYTLLGNYRALQNALNRLNAYMHAEDLKKVNKRYFMDAMENPGKLLGTHEVAKTSGGLAAYRTECLENLRQAARYIRQCKVSLRPLLRKNALDDKAVDRILSVLQNQHRELDALCMDPSVFFGHRTHTEVSQFAGRLAGLIDHLKRDPTQTPVYWEKNLESRYDISLDQIQKEIKGLIQ